MITDAGTSTNPDANRTCRRCGKTVFVGYMRHVGGGEFEHCEPCVRVKRTELERGELRTAYVFQKHGKGRYQ